MYLDERDIFRREHDFLTELFAEMESDEFVIHYIRGVNDFTNFLIHKREEHD